MQRICKYSTNIYAGIKQLLNPRDVPEMAKSSTCSCTDDSVTTRAKRKLEVNPASAYQRLPFSFVLSSRSITGREALQTSLLVNRLFRARTVCMHRCIHVTHASRRRRWISSEPRGTRCQEKRIRQREYKYRAPDCRADFGVTNAARTMRIACRHDRACGCAARSRAGMIERGN